METEVMNGPCLSRIRMPGNGTVALSIFSILCISVRFRITGDYHSNDSLRRKIEEIKEIEECRKHAGERLRHRYDGTGFISTMAIASRLLESGGTGRTRTANL